MASQKIIRKIISSSLGPKPIGPYNQAVLVDHTLYLSGSLGVDVKTGKLVAGGAAVEARQALINMGHILKEAGSNYDKVVKTTIFLQDINEFSDVNEVYKEFFKENYPARSTFQVGKLPMGAKFEIEAIAVVGEVETI
ncbi:2-iminobutanoate/2-iminopropanoate deaminase [Bombus vosnesenskii]|uniref:2-iminobutanoate/2-iminopropanoate deaminase n=3 Tax=Pyrobombus TaxID=144703 RepID=A0A6J3KAM0_9HYME|nr:2-iminobutanoate/2-iminopropanoate deaminase [Bombus impatiens]XP_033194304.1 2-iminobutanoate/2-iminopropanoate deaminase-like [Bombus vancouverensis nearcticus]XP_033313946.1 2-iminobutanoate/2-iminopropanoate deaminase-like [Bombus bifarius]XP_033350157.1 2-iminobutanoate/2-iminopropanoate deaminase [Bombus vosnesenskii]XP_050475684.1 2-iminobutanoate/2-iminopropanoate deaminase [Bombus huntii]